ncbi:Chromosome partition protein Smc [compost metagenome]
MNVQFIRAATRMALLGTALSGLAACASAQSEAPRPTVKQVEDKPAASTPVTPPPAAAPAAAARPSSTVAELQGLIQSRQVSELRTAYNGTYGASLLFKPDDLTYYVALFQQKDFWRVLKTLSEKQAESTYRAFAAQSADLAEVDIKRIKLQAEYANAEKLLASRSAQLSTLQADRTLRMQQEEQVAARQEQSRQEATALADQQKDVRQQLRDLQRQIDSLQAQQAQIDGSAAAKRGK